MNKVQFFEAASIGELNEKVTEFMQDYSIIDVKVAVNQSMHKPLYSEFIAAVIYHDK